MDVSYCIRTSFLLLFIVPSSWLLENSISITGNTVMGGDAFVTCRWVLQPYNIIRRVTILSPVNGAFTQYYAVNYVTFQQTGIQYHNRISVMWDLPSQKAVMRIENLQCSDEREYACYFVFSDTMYGTGKDRDIKRAPLLIEVPPSSLTMQIKTPHSITAGEYVEIHRGDTIDAICSGSIDKRLTPRIDWIIFHNCKQERIRTNDSRIKIVEFVESLPGDIECGRRVQQNLTLKISNQDDFLMVSCLLHYDDTPAVKDPVFCWDPTTDTCIRSEPITFAQLRLQDPPMPFKSLNQEESRTVTDAVKIFSAGIICMCAGLAVGATVRNSRRNKKKHAGTPLQKKQTHEYN